MMIESFSDFNDIFNNSYNNSFNDDYSNKFDMISVNN
jgi:hypothetical protein